MQKFAKAIKEIKIYTAVSFSLELSGQIRGAILQADIILKQMKI